MLNPDTGAPYLFGADMAGPFAALAAVLIVFGFASPQFLTGATFGSVAFQLPELGILTRKLRAAALTDALTEQIRPLLDAIVEADAAGAVQ